MDRREDRPNPPPPRALLDQPEELARRTLLIASHFAVEAMRRYSESYPDQAAALARAGCALAVQVDELLSDAPRVALMAVSGDQRVEVVHVCLSKTSSGITH